MMPPSRSSSIGALPLSTHTPLMPAPLIRADILAMASADAALGLRYLPPLPRAPLGVQAQQQFFVPPVPPPVVAAQPPQPERSRGRRSAAAAAAAASTGAPGASSAMRPTVPGGGWGKAGLAPAPTNASASSGSSCGTSAAAAAARAAAAKKAIAEANRTASLSSGNRGVENAQARAVTARLSAPSSRRGSASAASAAADKAEPAQHTPPNPETHQQAPPPMGQHSEHEKELQELRAANLALKHQMETSKAASRRETPRHSPPRTPRALSRAHSQAGSRLSSPRGSAPTSPRIGGAGVARTPRRLALAQAQAAEKERMEAEASAAALTEAVATTDLLALRAARADLLAREFEERARLTEEQAHRPHYYLYQAREEVKELKSSILPLLAQADQALSRISAQASEAPSTIRSRSLAHTLSKASAASIARNADALGDRILDHLLCDTIRELDAIEAAKALDHRAAIDASSLAQAWEVAEEYERVRAEMEAKYARPGEHGKVRQHLPEVHVPRPGATNAAAAAREAPHLQPTSPTFHAPPSTSHAPYASQPRQHPQAVPPSLSSSMRSSNYPPPSTFQSSTAATPASTHTVAAHAAAVVPASASASAPFASRSSGFAVLPSLPEMVSRVVSDRAAFEDHVARRNQQQFLMPHQLQLHTIVAAAGDDILDSLLSSVCAEVGSVCDSYVERVFDAEFQVDLEQMTDMDWREQQLAEQQAQHRELDQAAGFETESHQQQQLQEQQEQGEWQ